MKKDDVFRLLRGFNYRQTNGQIDICDRVNLEARKKEESKIYIPTKSSLLSDNIKNVDSGFFLFFNVM